MWKILKDGKILYQGSEDYILSQLRRFKKVRIIDSKSEITVIRNDGSLHLKFSI